jgi:RNA polymerase sigma-70 factor (ECF subfamily)
MEDDFVARFRAGHRETLEKTYRDAFTRVAAAAGRVLSSVDAETVTHEVFFRMLSDADFRASFRGGNIVAWLAQVAANAAIDTVRRRHREVGEAENDDADPARFDEEVEAKMLIERFVAERLPQKFHALFDARFIRQLPQREAAAELRMQRSTLAYQEDRIRELLESFLLEGT